MDTVENVDFYRPYVLPDETILWRGKPEKGNLVTGQDVVLSLFGVFWLGFSLFWEYGVMESGAPVFFCLWGLPFIAVGIYMVAGRFVQTAYLRGRTFYCITSKKILVKRGSKVRLYDGRDLPPMDVVIHRNGNGTIRFYDTVYHGRRRGYGRYFALENLADVVQAQNAVSRMDGR